MASDHCASLFGHNRILDLVPLHIFSTSHKSFTKKIVVAKKKKKVQKDEFKEIPDPHQILFVETLMKKWCGVFVVI